MRTATWRWSPRARRASAPSLFIMCCESNDEGDRQSPWPDAKAEEEGVEFDAIFKGQEYENQCVSHEESWCLLLKCLHRLKLMVRALSLKSEEGLFYAVRARTTGTGKGLGPMMKQRRKMMSLKPSSRAKRTGSGAARMQRAWPRVWKICWRTWRLQLRKTWKQSRMAALPS